VVGFNGWGPKVGGQEFRYKERDPKRRTKWL